MADTKRQNILDNLVTVITGITGIELAEADSKRSLHTVTADKMPFVNIIQSGATLNEEKSSLQLEVFEIEVGISIFSTAGNIESLRGKIKEEIALDESRGGNAENTTYHGDTGIENLEIPNSTQALTMFVRIDYLLERGKKI